MDEIYLKFVKYLGLRIFTFIFFVYTNSIIYFWTFHNLLSPNVHF